jgi:hypothetical protein
MITNALRRLRRLDRNREGVPGEHWATLGAGLTLLGWAVRTPSPWLRAGAGLAGVLLIVRSCAGRDGPWARLRSVTAVPSLPAPEARRPVE